MSEQETTDNIEPESAVVDPVKFDEPKNDSSQCMSKNDTLDSSEQNSTNLLPETIEIRPQSPDTEVSKLISSPGNEGIPIIESVDSVSPENVLEVSIKNPEKTSDDLPVQSINLTSAEHADSPKKEDPEGPSIDDEEQKTDESSDPQITLTSTQDACPSKETDKVIPSTESGNTKSFDSSDKKDKTEVLPVTKGLRTSSKIKVLISSVSIPIDSMKSPQNTSSSSVLSASDQNENENSNTFTKPNAIPKESHKEIEVPPNEAEKTQSSEQYAEHVTYTEDGTAIYVDPKTQYKYKWSPEKNDWIAFDEGTTNPPANGNDDDNKKSNPYENEHYRWCSESNQWIPKNTEQQISSLTETEHYRWDAVKNEWIMKNQVPSLDDVTYGYEDGVRIYTDKDGTVFFWDADKKAWFPKIDDDFMARYQMSYGFIDNTSAPAAAAEEEAKKVELEKKVEELKKTEASAGGGVKRKAPPEPPKWFEIDPTQNTKVYVSNLPLDITMEEFSELMSKCGMIMKDPQTQKQKLKLYSESDGQLKGDGLCDYIKVESVDLALKLLDESVVRGCKIKVQRAKFQMRGEYNPTLKPKRKKKDKEKLIKMKEKLFDWRPEKMRGERSKHERTVIIKNLFTPELFDKEVHLIIDYQNDLREECSKCGTVRKVVIYDRHVEGVAQINMADPEQADLVIQMMNGRFFGQRKLVAEMWDGKTKYKVAETENEIQKRINKWDKYLEKGEEKEEEEDDESSDEATKNENDSGAADEVAPVPTT